jgi:hypothetical protein
MRTLTFDLSIPPACPQCKTVFPHQRIIQNRNSGAAMAVCEGCRTSTRIILPEVSKKLVYLDQSFLSDVLPAEDSSNPCDIRFRILQKLLSLKARQKIFVVVSDVHFAETAAIPIGRDEKRRRLLTFQNQLADGAIASDVAEVFVHQQRRKLSDPLGSESFSLSDIGLKDPFRFKLGTQVIPTNTWLGRVHQPLATTESRANLQANLRDILIRQSHDLGTQRSRLDCLTLVRKKWRTDLQLGIKSAREQAAFLADIARLAELTFGIESPMPPIPKSCNFLLTVRRISEGLGNDGLDRLERLLEDDPTGGCASIRLRTALEAEVLFAWCSCERTGKTFNDKKFGVSRLNDINHISVFLPYVDALTTDDDSARLCRRDVAALEVSRAKGKLFSAATYGEFERWLDGLEDEGAE